MSIAAIWSIINTILLFGIISYIFLLHKYINKNDIVNYVSQIFQINRKNLEKDLEIFLEEVKHKYKIHQNEIIELLKEQEKETEILKKTIEEETKIFKKYCEERVEFQEEIVNHIIKKLNNATKKISQLKGQLVKCKRKIERLENDTKTS